VNDAQFAVVNYDASTGAEIWQHLRGVYDDSFFLYGIGAKVIVDGLGDVIAAGNIVNGNGLARLHAVKMSEALSGRSLLVESPAPAAPATRLSLLSRDRNVFDVRAPSDPTVGGATLELRNPATGEIEVISLTNANWVATPTFSGEFKYAYNDQSGAPGTCRKLRITTGRNGRILADCIPATFTLDESSQGSLAVTLTLGGGPRFCMRFGGTVVTDVPGSFSATNAPAVRPCPGV
jgi:hypothetical protein